MEKENKKSSKVLYIVIAVIVLWGIAAILLGPDSKFAINQRLEKLQEDSIALQGDFRPKGHYSFYQDIVTEIERIRDLGKPYRSSDSVQIFENPMTAAIANYNIAKCDSVLNKVLPQWRIMFSFVLNSQLYDKNTIVRLSKEDEDNTGISLYSLKYLSDDEIRNDMLWYKSDFKTLGFKKVTFAPSPEGGGVTYTFKD